MLAHSVSAQTDSVLHVSLWLLNLHRWCSLNRCCFS